MKRPRGHRSGGLAAYSSCALDICACLGLVAYVLLVFCVLLFKCEVRIRSSNLLEATSICEFQANPGGRVLPPGGTGPAPAHAWGSNMGHGHAWGSGFGACVVLYKTKTPPPRPNVLPTRWPTADGRLFSFVFFFLSFLREPPCSSSLLSLGFSAPVLGGFYKGAARRALGRARPVAVCGQEDSTSKGGK